MAYFYSHYSHIKEHRLIFDVTDKPKKTAANKPQPQLESGSVQESETMMIKLAEQIKALEQQLDERAQEILGGDSDLHFPYSVEKAIQVCDEKIRLAINGDNMRQKDRWDGLRSQLKRLQHQHRTAEEKLRALSKKRDEGEAEEWSPTFTIPPWNTEFAEHRLARLEQKLEEMFTLSPGFDSWNLEARREQLHSLTFMMRELQHAQMPAEFRSQAASLLVKVRDGYREIQQEIDGAVLKEQEHDRVPLEWLTQWNEVVSHLRTRNREHGVVSIESREFGTAEITLWTGEKLRLNLRYNTLQPEQWSVGIGSIDSRHVNQKQSTRPIGTVVPLLIKQRAGIDDADTQRERHAVESALRSTQEIVSGVKDSDQQAKIFLRLLIDGMVMENNQQIEEEMLRQRAVEVRFRHHFGGMSSASIHFNEQGQVEGMSTLSITSGKIERKTGDQNVVLHHLIDLTTGNRFEKSVQESKSKILDIVQQRIGGSVTPSERRIAKPTFELTYQYNSLGLPKNKTASCLVVFNDFGYIESASIYDSGGRHPQGKSSELKGSTNATLQQVIGEAVASRLLEE